MSHALARVADDPRFEPAKYVGKHGWITMDATSSDDWEEIRALVLEGYKLVAPKKSLAKLDGGAPPGKTGTPKKAKEAAAPSKAAAKITPKKR